MGLEEIWVKCSRGCALVGVSAIFEKGAVVVFGGRLYNYDRFASDKGSSRRENR
ncbi:hypothetical protein CCP2SC5_60035 [Azospirillaceae bacterium]